MTGVLNCTHYAGVLLQERFGNTLEMGRRKKKKKITCTLVTFSHILHADFNQENQSKLPVQCRLCKYRKQCYVFCSFMLATQSIKKAVQKTF